MATPTYVAKKIGDQYVVVPKNPAATKQGSSCLIGGATLMLAGAWMRGLSGLAVSLLGVELLGRCVTGRSLAQLLLRPYAGIGGPNGDPRQSPTFQNDVLPTTQAPADEIDEAVMQSFPASDPPARTVTA